MGSLWGAATRGEGYRLGRKDHGLIIIVNLTLGTVRLVFRFVSGRPMFGDRSRKTDAEFFKAGTRKLYANDRSPGRWSWLPEWKRAAIRVTVLIVVVAGLWYWQSGALFDSSATHNAVSVAAIAIVASTVWFLIVRIDNRVREAKHRHGLTGPFRVAVAPILGIAARDVRVDLPRRNLTEKGDKAA